MPSPGQDELLALGRAIRGLREERGLSARELAASSQVSVALLHGLENGMIDPGLELLVRLSRSLGIAAAVVFERAQRIADGEQ
jgi:transcriptional regulator with XRE-family HTH domain